MARIYYLHHRKGLSHMSTHVHYGNPESVAQGILSENGIEDFPVNPLKIARSEGIEILQTDFGGRAISGAISSRNGKSVIYVNEHHAPVRQKFTIAHELGHYFLHIRNTGEDHYVDNDLTLYRANMGVALNSDQVRQERQANQFAAALIMPKAHIETEWLFSDDVDDMARQFGVSSVAMQIRLKDLGLI